MQLAKKFNLNVMEQDDPSKPKESRQIFDESI